MVHFVKQSDDRKLLNALSDADGLLVQGKSPQEVFGPLLEVILELTGSCWGVFAELPVEDKHFLVHSFIDKNSKQFNGALNVNQSSALSSLYEDGNFTKKITESKHSIILNNANKDLFFTPQIKGFSKVKKFLALPFIRNSEINGVLVIGNRSNGYDHNDIDFLQPVVSICSSLIFLYRDERNLVSSWRDIKNSEINYWKEKLTLQAILDSTLDSIISIDTVGNVLSVNPATQSTFGYTSEEIVGKNISMLMPEPHRSEHDGYLQKYLLTGEKNIIGKIGRKVKGLKKDGTVFPIDLKVGEIESSGKKTYTGIVHDLTESYKTEQRAENALIELKKSNDDLLAILNSQQLNTIIVNDENIVEFISQELCDEISMNHDEIVGGKWQDILPFNRESISEIQQQTKILEKDRKKVSVNFQKNNKEFWFDCEIHNYPRTLDKIIFFLYDMSELKSLRQELDETSTYKILGNSEKMLGLYTSINDIAVGDWDVLIEGETGVGKELVARSIHSNSDRSSDAFVAVNCAGLTESLINSTLFGHVKGAFTGAVNNKKGLFEAADGGTLFLDEIGDIPPLTQTALLRVLQEREIMRIGETKPRKVNVRIITATHGNLSKMVELGQFRQDLFYRLRVARINVPALRERSSDIPLLASTFLAETRFRTKKIISEISNAAMQLLMKYSWPGNVRELRNAIEFSVMHTTGKLIGPHDLPPEIHINANESKENTSYIPIPATEMNERERIEHTLHLTNGNRSLAAEKLGMSRATFYRRLEQYNIS